MYCDHSYTLWAMIGERGKLLCVINQRLLGGGQERGVVDGIFEYVRNSQLNQTTDFSHSNPGSRMRGGSKCENERTYYTSQDANRPPKMMRLD